MLSPLRAHDTAERRFQLLVDAVVDYGIFMLDPQGHIVSWNSGAEKLKGYRRDEILGRHFSVFYPPEVVATGWPQEELRRARLAGRFEDEGWRIRKDGTRFWANVVITALQDEAGAITGFAKITRDLTERRRHEEVLRESEARFRLLVESVRDYAIFMLDPGGNVRSWNAGAQALKGYTAQEIIGRHFSAFYTPEDQAAGKPAAALRAARRDGRVEATGWRVRKDGTLFWANVVVTAVHGDSGELIGFAKVTRDMTDRRRVEELERSSRMMTQFLAMLAHELRNPLAPMRNAVTLMQLEHTASPALKNARDIIDRQLTHLTHLVDDLLDVGRLTTGKVALRLEPTAVGEVVGRAVETARPLIEARRHTLTLDLPPEPVTINADPTRLAQIVQNLLVNAAKYTPDGGRVGVKVEAANGFVTVAVSDTGRGIAAADLERMFELFAQGDNDVPNDSGLGVGLTLARSLAEMHGGRLDAESAGRGRGSTFLLRLPLAGPHDQAPGDQVGSDFKVLVVDDNRDSADSAAAIIRLLGYGAVCAYDGSNALRAAQQQQPDLVLLDLAMPQLDGYATLQRLRALPGFGQTPVIAMTGYGSAQDRQRTTEAGFDGHLTKPVELNALVELVNRARGTQ
ncbi:PAS domain S-box protein [Ramlibacter sp.]|uniref:PAS domain-containing hybrid sensor histidine kinase/response regulator n=1 Tax=Ramlibacter sp. TaxID=1917967 RepID=UPI002C5C48FC|nr:PAS domain S-box protein [Ramlibacter sp.]HWI81866.1 PAS domain S-box protein [Ramlibacter sp.]